MVCYNLALAKRPLKQHINIEGSLYFNHPIIAWEFHIYHSNSFGTWLSYAFALSYVHVPFHLKLVQEWFKYSGTNRHIETD